MPSASWTDDAASLLDGIAGVLWPILAALGLFIVARHLLPEIRGILVTRGFTLRVGPFELTAQQNVERQEKQLDDLRKEVFRQGSQLADLQAGAPAAEGPAEGFDGGFPMPSSPEWLHKLTHGYRRVLWVDDDPAGNAYEIASVEREGIRVDSAETTAAALAIFEPDQHDVVVTDLGREESGRYNPTAGLDLIAGLREIRPDLPVYIYTSGGNVRKSEERAKQAGAAGITNSSAELLALLLQTGSGFGRQFKQLVHATLEGADSSVRRGDNVDFVVETGTGMTIVEAKTWRALPGNAELDQTMRRLEAAVEEVGAREALLVTPRAVQMPAKIAAKFPRVRAVAVAGLRVYLGF